MIGDNMDKIEMAKYIPQKTLYCGECPWRTHITDIYLNKEEKNCPFNDNCEDNHICWTTAQTYCRTRVYRCEYLDYTDWNEDSLLWDEVKECGISDE